MKTIPFSIFCFLFLCAWFLTVSCSSTSLPVLDDESPEDESGSSEVNEVKIAFIGDQGLGEDSQAVLRLIQSEGADAVFHQGDFDYTNDPDAWDNQINEILGEDFPYFASIGNHDEEEWENYQAKLEARLERVSDAECTGDIGMNASCNFRGIFVVFSGVGTLGDDHEEFLEDQLTADTSRWRICSWHKNQRLMQVGGKGDEVGWEAYEICREQGAIIATAHEHSYSRTYLMEDLENQVISSTSDNLVLEKGETFVFVSGLGGNSIREEDAELAAHSWWASIYTETEGADYGALFCVFNVDQVEGEGECYFKDINGNVPDTFTLTSQVNSE